MKKLTTGGGIVALIIMLWAGIAQAHSLHASCEGVATGQGDSTFHSTTPPGITIAGNGGSVTWAQIGADSIAGTFDTGEHGSASKPENCQTTTTIAPTTTVKAPTTTAAATTTLPAPTTTVGTTTVPGSVPGSLPGTTTTVAGTQTTPTTVEAPGTPPRSRTFLAPTPAGQTPPSAQGGLPHTGPDTLVWYCLAIAMAATAVGILLWQFAKRWHRPA